MTRVTAHSARAREAWRAANGNLLLNVLIKLVDSGYVPIETVYFVGEFVKLFDNSLVVVLRR